MLPWIISLAVLAVALLGHTGIWITLNNWAHATAWPRWCIKSVSLATYGILVAGPAWAVSWLWLNGPSPSVPWAPWSLAVLVYVVICVVAGIFFVLPWWWRGYTARHPEILRSNHTSVIRVADAIGHWPASGIKTSTLSRLPKNQIFDLHIHDEVLDVPSLPPALDGLSITHISDVHLKGHIRLAYHEEVIRQANALGSDLVVLTGDLIESAHCIDDGAALLGGLRAEFGVYFVLGNHDLRVRDVPWLRRALVAAGLIDLGGHSRTLPIRGTSVLLAGNELPWFGPAPNVGEVPARDQGGPAFRILLSHSPDQYKWARERGFDLVLAGHNHGGQIQFPLVGPVVAPSRYGVRYHSGVFHEPPTVMHVSRGVSGLFPIRWRCPPELAKLTLKAPSQDGRDAARIE